MLLLVNAGIKLIKSIKCILFIVLDSFQGICPVKVFPHPVLYSKFLYNLNVHLCRFLNLRGDASRF